MIEVKTVNKSYGDRQVIFDLSLGINEGEILIVLGENGAGKTSLLRLLCGIIFPDSGSVSVDGLDTVSHFNSIKNITGILTENPGLYYRMNLFEYLEFFGRLFGLRGKELDDRVKAVIDVLGLGHFAYYPLHEFSKGLKQKATIARSLLHSPKYLLLDEPTSALDPESSKNIREFIRAERDRGHGIVISTHNTEEAWRLGERIMIIREGRNVFFGTKNEFLFSRHDIDNFRVKLKSRGQLALAAESIRSFGGAAINAVNIAADENEVRFNYRGEGNWSHLLIKRLVHDNIEVEEFSPNRNYFEEAYIRIHNGT